jgi:hypothetical protein
MAGRGADRGERGASGEPADLQRPEDHCGELIAIVDGFNPTPELRGWALRAMDAEAVAAWHELLARWWRHQAERKGKPPPGRGRGRPRNLLARDLARGCARVWQQLGGEFPPIGKECDSDFVEMVRHAFGRAGLRGFERHAYLAALRVSREIEAQRPAPGNFMVMRIKSVETPDGRRLSEDGLRAIGFGLTDDELRQIGVFKTPPRPRRGPKPKAKKS